MLIALTYKLSLLASAVRNPWESNSLVNFSHIIAEGDNLTNFGYVIIILNQDSWPFYFPVPTASLINLTAFTETLMAIVLDLSNAIEFSVHNILLLCLDLFICFNETFLLGVIELRCTSLVIPCFTWQ